MGYTHYWEAESKIALTPKQKLMLAEIMKDHKDVIEKGKYHSVAKSVIHINGFGDEGYEDFHFDCKKPEDDFCKTAQKPYDEAVAKILCVLSLSKGFTFRSDGLGYREGKLDVNDWKKTFEWFAKQGCMEKVKTILKAVKARGIEQAEEAKKRETVNKKIRKKNNVDQPHWAGRYECHNPSANNHKYYEAKLENDQAVVTYGRCEGYGRASTAKTIIKSIYDIADVIAKKCSQGGYRRVT